MFLPLILVVKFGGIPFIYVAENVFRSREFVYKTSFATPFEYV